jgi:prevent-host-death family protein
MTTISAEEARNQLSDIVNRAAYAKEHIVLTRRGKKMAAIIPVDELELLESLMDELEDKMDVAAAAAAIEESEKSGTTSWEQIKAEQGL